MSDYSSFSMDELETMYRYAYAAYNNLYCPVGAECKDCVVSDDCDALS